MKPNEEKEEVEKRKTLENEIIMNIIMKKQIRFRRY